MAGFATSGLSELSRVNLRQQALTALRRSISSGEIPAGTHLRETELSETLGISRGTLREALRQLQQEGLVAPSPSGRLSVRHLDNDEIVGIFQVRSTLEELGAALIAESDDRTSRCRALEDRVRRMSDAREKRVELDEQIEIDLEFHRQLCRESGNATLLHSWELLEGSIRMSIVWAGRERAIRNMDWKRHQDIVDAIATGDPSQARRAVRDHMDQAMTTLVTAISDPKPGSTGVEGSGRAS